MKGILSWFRRNDAAPPPPEREPGDLTTAELSAIYGAVSVLETGFAPSDEAYSRLPPLNVLPDGAGISYGLHQCTARSTLPAVLEAYYEAGGRLRIAGTEIPLEVARARALSSVGVMPGRTSPEIDALCRALADAGSEPAMQRAQRDVLERDYWRPTHRAGQLLMLRRPLSYLALYDLSIQSGAPQLTRPLTTGMLARLRPNFPELPPSKGGGERLWVVAMLQARRRFLASSSREVVRRSVYRVDALLDLCDDGLWDLALPLTVRGVTIGADPIDAPPPRAA
jgi:chitosanase